MIEIRNPHKKNTFPRSAGLEEHFYRIIRKITGCNEGKVSGGCDYENEVFVIRKPFIGACPCKLCEMKRDFEEDNEHASNCFQSDWNILVEKYKKHPMYGLAPQLKIAKAEDERYLMKQHGIPLKDRKDPTNVCSCHYKGKMQKELGGVGFIEECYFNLPNFHFKLNGFKLWVDRNFFRNTFMNMSTDEKKFKQMCKECVMSLPRFNHPVPEMSGEDVGGQF